MWLTLSRCFCIIDYLEISRSSRGSRLSSPSKRASPLLAARCIRCDHALYKVGARASEIESSNFFTSAPPCAHLTPSIFYASTPNCDEIGENRSIIRNYRSFSDFPNATQTPRLRSRFEKTKRLGSDSLEIGIQSLSDWGPFSLFLGSKD